MSAAETLNASQDSHTMVVPGQGAYSTGDAGAPTKAGSTNGSAGFVQGVSSETINALLSVMTILQEIANIYGELMIQQVNTQKDLANNLSQFNINLGNEQGDEMIAQGIAGAVGGGLTVASVVGAHIAGSTGCTEENENLTGAKSYQDLAENRSNPEARMSDTQELEMEDMSNRLTPESRASDPELDSKVKQRLQELKTRTEFVDENGKAVNARKDTAATRTSDGELTDEQVVKLLHEDELSSLKESLSDRVKSLEGKYNNAFQSRQSLSQKLSTAGQGIGAISQGVGSSVASNYKRDQGESNAEVSSSQAALNTAQGLSSQSRSNTETYLGKSFDVAQIISAISQSNKTVN